MNSRSRNTSSYRLSRNEIKLAKENLRSMRDQVREFLADQSGRDPEEMKREVESAPMPHPFE